jgi:hypothetical protein
MQMVTVTLHAVVTAMTTTQRYDQTLKKLATLSMMIVTEA